LLAGEPQDTLADLLIARANLLNHPVDRNPVGEQPIGIHRDLVLPDETPDGGNLGDARHSADLILDLPVLQSPQVRKRVFTALVNECVLERPTYTGRIGPE